MLPLIPASMALTIIVSFFVMMQKPDIHNDAPSIIANNMLMQHDRSVREYINAIASPGAFESYAGLEGTIFINMGDWQTQSFDGMDRTIIATWPGELAEATNTKLAMGKFSKSSMRHLPKTQAGIYLNSEEGALVGNMILNDVMLPVDFETPMIVTIIENN